MTGFGTASVQLPSKKITVDIKSLNSKQFDMNSRIPIALRSIEIELRGKVAGRLERGKIDLTVTTENVGSSTSVRINPEAVAAYKLQIEATSAATGLPLPHDWYSLLLKLPDVLVAADENDPAKTDEMAAASLVAVDKAVEALMDYRRAEGVKLEEFFTVRIDRIRKLLDEVPQFENERIEHIRSRLADGLSKIPAIEFDKGRLEQEMIFYIEKLDVNEEKQRLAQHLSYFIETMNMPAPGQGKKLGFIAQEMGREINTLGSKSSHAEMQRLVVRMKDELEQIKEQVLNVM